MSVTNAKKLARWFLCAGGFGVLIALALKAIATAHPISPGVLRVLWPWSIVGAADPSTVSGKILVGLIEFGGQFVVYGIVGAMLGAAFPGSGKNSR